MIIFKILLFAYIVLRILKALTHKYNTDYKFRWAFDYNFPVLFFLGLAIGGLVLLVLFLKDKEYKCVDNGVIKSSTMIDTDTYEVLFELEDGRKWTKDYTSEEAIPANGSQICIKEELVPIQK